MNNPLATPALDVSEWLNKPDPIELSQLLGRVVVIHAFQMLCPGCVSHGIPQATEIHNTFPHLDVVVLGLHTVFEHHAVMGPEALRAFVHEYQIAFPIGIDRAQPGNAIPSTMQRLGLKGTPSLIVLDRQGSMRLHHFGRASDMGVGALIGRLLAEGASATPVPPAAGADEQSNDASKSCTDQYCPK